MASAITTAFQSSPTPGSRCNSPCLMHTSGLLSCFNPHRLLGAGATALADGWSCGIPCFNPHRLLGAGATILSRESLGTGLRFQSSPTPGSRCNGKPARVLDLLGEVSILTDSWEPVQRVRIGARRCPAQGVSILTDSREPVQLDPTGTSTGDMAGFNPHRLLGAGATRAARRGSRRDECFNPHRLLGAGATCEIIGQPLAIYAFQSSPTPGSRCNPLDYADSQAGSSFQSSPTPGSRCNAGDRARHVRQSAVSILTDSWEPVQRAGGRGRIGVPESFNPHRLLGAGATVDRAGQEHRGRVSILTDSWEPVQQLTALDKSIEAAFQSSPTPGSRCNWRNRDRYFCRVEFQSSPTPGSRCNGRLRAVRRTR